MNSKILVIISSSEKNKARTGAMYAVNALRNKWMDEVKLFFFGPAEKLLLSDEELRQTVEEFNAMKEQPVACKFIAEKENTDKQLSELGVSVEYVSKPISDFIKQGFVPLVW